MRRSDGIQLSQRHAAGQTRHRWLDSGRCSVRPLSISKRSRGRAARATPLSTFVPKRSAAGGRILTGWTRIHQREVLIVKVLDKPGMLGDVALVMAQANINTTRSTHTKDTLVLGVDFDLDGGYPGCTGMAVMAFE